MSFSRANPSGWGAKGEVTSAQINAIDIDHANSVDKAGGDTITGTIHIASGGGLIVDQGSTFGIGATSSTNAVVPVFAANQTRTKGSRCRPFPALTSGWTPTSNGYVSGPGTGTTVNFEVARVPNGATITSVTLGVIISNSHSGIPGNLPAFTVFRLDLTTGAVVSCGPAATFPTPGSTAAYIAASAEQFWGVTLTGNNVMDESKYEFFAQLSDESGTNAIAGNNYVSVLAVVSIPDMRL